MNESWVNSLIDSTTFILGNKKNAGKTTFMNLALNKIRKQCTPAFCSVGIDGEPFDLIDGNEKPLVKTYPGDVIITTQLMIQKSSGQFKWLKVFPFKTSLGQLIAVETLRQGHIEIVGPEHNNDLRKIIAYLKNELKISCILIDGAANRITPMHAVNGASFIYICNIARSDLKKSIENMKTIFLANSFPRYINSEQIAKKCHSIKGALTTSKMKQIPLDTELLIVESDTSFFLSNKQLFDLSNKMQIVLIQKAELKSFVAILKDVDVEQFMRLCNENLLSDKTILNPYVN